MRNKPFEVRHRFDVRMLFFYAVVPLLLGLLLFQIMRLQWFEHDKYMLQSEQNRLNIVPILPVRGEIIDAQGKKLAINRIAYRVSLIPERIEHLDKTLNTLADMLAWTSAKLRLIRKRIKRTRRPDRPVLLDDKLQWFQVSPLVARLHHLPGVDVAAGSYRQYPYAELTSHVIGYLSLARESDLNAGYLPTEFIGRTGIERSFEKILHGHPGHQREEVDSRGRRIAVLKRTPPVMGKQIQLALDVDVQQAASDALGDRTGAVVVMDVRSGGIIAMLSKPGYDTNRFITGLESRQWQSWLNNPEKPLLNRATQAAYPPASTFKLVTALAGLKHGVRLANGSTTCPGYLKLADRKLHCWKHWGHGKVSLQKALIQSCDVYFYKLGDQLGMAAISHAASDWGLGEKTQIDLSSESPGVIPTQSPYMMAAIKDSHSKRKKWFRGETMITAIGQGALTTTPLQIARLAAAIANGGKVLKPQLLAGAPVEILHQVAVKPANLRKIQKAMRGVVTNVHGTAHRALSHAAWNAAGKTGTAQVVKMAKRDGQGANQKELIRRHKDHAWFMGYAPYKHPKIAIAVFVEHGGHGGSAAGPVAAAIIEAMARKEHGTTEAASQ
ncbi:MAG: penicillin-binding protein 2 [Mariprofundus sp.]|nr:penicillin-binding protein 2 [Mariprofundus sp.]